MNSLRDNSTGARATSRDIALSLSGGGFRAALFHLGVLKGLYEQNLMDRLKMVSSVSGGSIIAGALARCQLSGDSFTDFFDQTLEYLSNKKIDRLGFFFGSTFIERQYDELMQIDGQQVRMSDLGDLDIAFVFNSTAVHSGRGWRFLPGGIVEEWDPLLSQHATLGCAFDRYKCDVSVAKAVAASAAFPLFSAVTLRRDSIYRDSSNQNRNFFQDLPDPVCLSDGGVRDNIGVLAILTEQLQHLAANYILIGSDGGAVLTTPTRPQRGRLRKITYILRNFDIIGNHNGMVTINLAHVSRLSVPRRTAIFSIHEIAEEEGERADRVGELGSLSTRLRPFDWNIKHRLMSHGTSLLRKSLRMIDF